MRTVRWTTALSTFIATTIMLISAQRTTNTTVVPNTNVTLPSKTLIPLMLPKAPKLDRAHKSKILIEAPCENYCKYLLWQIKSPTDLMWRMAEYESHSNFPDTFYIRGLRPDTSYTIRALVRPRFGTPYSGNDVPVLEAKTCPERPPPIRDLHMHSAGPGWLEVRWKPPIKEDCKSHVFYQARYAPHGTYFSPWRTYGYFRSERWVHFRPTHPCAVWPQEFCLLMTDNVRPSELHEVEVRVSRFDEVVPALSESRKVTVRAETDCLSKQTCGVIGAPPDISSSSIPTDNISAVTFPNDVDINDADMPTTKMPPVTNLTFASTFTPVSQTTWSVTRVSNETAAAHMTAASTGDSTFGRLSPLFLALLLLACAALPVAFIIGRRRGAREAVDLHRVPAWKRRCGGDGGSQPVLVEEGAEEDEEDNRDMQGATIDIDHHGRFSWAKLLPQDA